MYVIHRQCASRVRAVLPADSKESHNQSFEISFRRAASEKGEKSRLGFIILTMVGAVVQSATLHSLLPTSYSTSFSLPAFVALRASCFFSPRYAYPYEYRKPYRPTGTTISRSLFHPLHPSSSPSRPADARIIAARLRHKAVSHHKGLFNPGNAEEKENGNENTSLHLPTLFSSLCSSPFLFRFPAFFSLSFLSRSFHSPPLTSFLSNLLPSFSVRSSRSIRLSIFLSSSLSFTLRPRRRRRW